MAHLSAYVTSVVNELKAIFKFIISATGEFWKETKIYLRELETKGIVWIRKTQEFLFVHKPLTHLITILSCHHYSSIHTFLARLNLIINSIDSKDYSLLQPQLSVKFLHLLILIILHRSIFGNRRETWLCKDISDSRAAQRKLGDTSGIIHQRRGFINHSIEGNERLLKRRSDKSETLIEEFLNPKGQIGLQNQSPLTLVNKKNIAVESIRGIITELQQTKKCPTTHLEIPSRLMCTAEQQGNFPLETETKEETRKEETQNQKTQALS